MNSKEALEKFKLLYENKCKSPNNIIGFDVCYSTIKQDLDRVEMLYEDRRKLLDKLEKVEKGNQELLVNKNVAQGIAKKFKEENIKFKKVIEILKDKLEITLYSHDEYFNPPMINGTEIFKKLTQEEYELLKEVLEND